jgi:hypothetical protein
MFAGRTVFAQLIGHVPPHEFHKCVEACLRSVESKLYHMGFRGKVSRSTPALIGRPQQFRRSHCCHSLI